MNLDAAYMAWQSPGIGRSLTFMAAQGFLCLVVICLVESDISRRVVRRIISALRVQHDVERSTVEHGVTATSVHEDSDVAAERQRIDSTPVERLSTTDAVVLRQLTKFYGSLLAVDRLSVGVPKGE